MHPVLGQALAAQKVAGWTAEAEKAALAQRIRRSRAPQRYTRRIQRTGQQPNPAAGPAAQTSLYLRASLGGSTKASVIYREGLRRECEDGGPGY